MLALDVKLPKLNYVNAVLEMQACLFITETKIPIQKIEYPFKNYKVLSPKFLKTSKNQRKKKIMEAKSS